LLRLLDGSLIANKCRDGARPFKGHSPDRCNSLASNDAPRRPAGAQPISQSRTIIYLVFSSKRDREPEMSKSVKSSKFKCLWISYFLPRSRCFLKNAITSRANQIYTFDPFALSSVCQRTGAVISQIANSRLRPVSRSIVAGPSSAASNSRGCAIIASACALDRASFSTVGTGCFRVLNAVLLESPLCQFG
jgi:hypothetical protein